MSNNNQISFIRYNGRPETNFWGTNATTIIINACADGTMAYGICAQTAQRHPEVVQAYMHQCEEGNVSVGQPVVIYAQNGLQFVFCPVKARSGDKPSAIALQSCLNAIAAFGRGHITSIATHKMGCGSGKEYLSWQSEVGPMLVHYLSQLGVPTEIYIGRNDATFEPVVQQSYETDPIMATPF